MPKVGAAAAPSAQQCPASWFHGNPTSSSSGQRVNSISRNSINSVLSGNLLILEKFCFLDLFGKTQCFGSPIRLEKAAEFIGWVTRIERQEPNTQGEHCIILSTAFSPTDITLT